MKKNHLLLRFAVLLAALMCALGASAAEAYANYQSSNWTLTFYYDNYRSSRTGTSYSLNTGYNDPAWYTDGTNASVTKVVFDPSFAGARPTSTCKWFYCMKDLYDIIGISYLNTSEVTNMAWMFSECRYLDWIDLSSFNTAKVTDMQNMFYRCYILTSLDLSSFNTAKVTNMEHMFHASYHLYGIYVGNAWKTTAVINSTGMFDGCTSLVGGKGTAYSLFNLNDHTYAHIDGGPSNPGYFRDKNVPEAYVCYSYVDSQNTLTFYYDTQRSSRTGTTYDLNTGSNEPIWLLPIDDSGPESICDYVTRVVFDPSFAGARPTTTYCWFYDMSNLETIEGMEYLNTSEVTRMDNMFHACYKLTSLDLSSFNTSKVTDMEDMFAHCESLTSLDLSHFNTSNVTNMEYMFCYCSKLRTICVGNGWTTASVIESSGMFDGCTSLVGGKGTTYSSSNPADKTYAHIDGGPSNPGYFTEKGPEAYACYTSSNTTLTFYYDNQHASRPGTTYFLNTADNYPGWYTDGNNASVTKVVFNSSFADARPTTTYCWFLNMQNLQSITGMSYLNTSEVTNMYGMFGYCTSLTSVDLSHFNTSKVTNMSCMFAFCGSLTSLDLSHFNTSNVTNMENMFQGDSNLRTVYVGNGWSTAAVTASDYMFYNCTSLVGGQGTTYNSSNPRDKTYAHIDGGPSNPGYFTAKNAGQRGDVNGDGNVNISDVTALINYLLSHNATGLNLQNANCNQDSTINISDVTALINYLLSHSW